MKITKTYKIHCAFRKPKSQARKLYNYIKKKPNLWVILINNDIRAILREYNILE